MIPGAFDSTLRVVLRVDVAQAVERTSERIDRAADELRTDRHLEHARRATNLVAFLELEVVAENDRTDVVLFEVQRERGDFVPRLGRRDLEHLAGHRLLQAIDARDAVFDFEDGSNLFDIELVKVSGFDFAKEDVLDFAGAECGVGGHTVLSESGTA